MQIHDYHDPPHPHSSQQIEKMSAPPKTATKPKASTSKAAPVEKVSEKPVDAAKPKSDAAAAKPTEPKAQ